MMYLNFILDPLKSVVSIIGAYVPTVITVLAVLVIGTLIAGMVGKLLARVLKDIHTDKISHTIGLAKVLENGGVKRPVSDVVGSITTWVLMITVFVITAQVAGVTVIGTTTDGLMAYVPSVFTGGITLTIGILLAHVVSTFVRMVLTSTGMPKPEMIATFSKWAIVLMAVKAFIDHIGLGFLLTGTPFVLILGGLSLAIGLAFGLGGRDHATRYLDKLLK